MTKRALLYRVLLYIVTLSIIVCGGFLYNSLKMQKMWSSSVQSVVDAEDIYGSNVRNIYPDGGEISLWDGTSSEAPAGLGDEFEPYLIASAANLNYFRLNAASFNNKYIKQTVNIDLQGNPWTPIAEGTYFYEGNGKSIYNLYINSSALTVGFFSRANSTTYVKNLNFIGVNILVNSSTTSNRTRVGTVFGSAYCTVGATIQNVHVTNANISINVAYANEIGGIHGGAQNMIDDKNSFDGNIYVETSLTSGWAMVGGICGASDIAGSITNCSTFGNIIVKAPNSGSPGGIQAGGIYGGDYAYPCSFTIDSCTSHMNIQSIAQQESHVGGILGVMARGETAIVNNCASYGNIYSESTNSTYAYPTSAGGISGYSSNLNIYNSQTYGNIFAKGIPNAWVGGVGGYCINTLIENCFSACNVLGTDNNGSDVQAEVGGIAGGLRGGATVRYCLFTGSVAEYENDCNTVGAIVGMTYNDVSGDNNVYYCYWNSDTVSSGHWETAYYRSNTPVVGYSLSANIGTNAGVTTSNLKITAFRTCPSSINLTQNWDFSMIGEYPHLRNMPTAVRLVAENKSIKLLMDTSNETYNGQEQQKDVQVCTYELKGFENNDPTSYWDGITTTQPNGKGTEAEPYLIESAANFAWVSANSQQEGGLALKKYYKQVVNIDLNNMFWTPIGPNFLCGEFYYDGNYHTIKNLYINTSSSYAALFGYLRKGYVKNIGVESGKVITTGGAYAAGVVAYAYDTSSVTNCYNKANIYSNSQKVGGVIGECHSITPCRSENLWNAGTIYANNFSYVGGVVGYVMYVPQHFVNTGKIVLHAQRSGDAYVGGVCGYQANPSLIVNYGDIVASGQGSIANTYVGGVAGQSAYVHGMFNFGSLAGLVGYTSKVGGLFGKGGSNTQAFYYNKEFIGVNVSHYAYTSSGTVVTSDDLGKTTSELIVTQEGTKPSVITSNVFGQWNYFRGQYPSVKSEVGKMTFYQKTIDESGTKPDISYWNGSYTNLEAPTLLNSGAANGETNPYIIDSASKLAWMSANPSSIVGKYYRQTIDIDLCGYKWTPISVGNLTLYYNGDNHTIYNLYVHLQEAGGFTAGFIRQLVGGYLKNLTINSGKVEVIGDFSSTTHAGVFVGQTYYPTIQNCHNIGVNIIAEQIACLRLGGIVGEAVYGTQILNCSNSGKVLNKSCGSPAVAGIAGCFYAQTNDGNAGNITNCVNYGYVESLTGSCWNCVGGIAGYTYIGRVNFTSCENYGDVYGVCFADECLVGGIIGVFVREGSASACNVTKCFNAGNVKGIENSSSMTANVGGIIGGVWGGTDSAGQKNISQCVNVGSVATKAGGSVAWLGGVVGVVVGPYQQFTNCYYNYETVASGHWDGSTTYISTSNDIQYLYGGSGDGSTINVSGCAPLSTAQLKSTTNGSAPSGTALSSGDWSFSAGKYPHVKAIPESCLMYDITQNFVATNKSYNDINVYVGGTAQPSLKYANVPNSESNPYIVKTASELVWISNNSQANDGAAIGKYYLQTVDIDLNNYSWTPISEDAARAIYYDGGNHTIYNLYIKKQSSGNNIGFVGFLGGNGYIKNLTLENGAIYVELTSNGTSVGAFAGAVYGTNSSTMATLSNLHNKNVSVNLYSKSASESRVAGISATIRYCNANNCTNTGKVYGYFGSSTARAGGLFGSCEYSINIKNCTNYGDVTVDVYDGHVVGGVAATFYDGSANAYQTMTGSKNYGNITVTHKINGHSSGAIRVAGIIGYSRIANNSISYCENFGTIYGLTADSNMTYIAGIVGIIENGNIISSCANHSKVIGITENGDGGLAAGICADSRGGVINNCYNTGDIYVKEVTALTPSAAGIIAFVRGTADNPTVVENCYNTGAVGVLNSGDTRFNWSGGIAGYKANQYYTISHCYSSLNATAISAQAGATYIPTSQLVGPYTGSKVVLSDDCLALTSLQMQSTKAGSAPSKMIGFEADAWEFKRGEYPTLKAFSTSQVISVWDGGSSALVGSGTIDDPYIIASASNLRFLALNCNNASYAGKYYKQVVDIDLNHIPWSPIYMESASIYYDGNNHTIHNLYINNDNQSSYNLNNPTTEYAGLFARIYNGYIKNLTIQGGSITVNQSTKHVQAAGICAEIGGNASTPAVIDNCHNINVSINASSSETANSYGVYAGGIVAHIYFGNVTNCSNSGDVNGIKTVGSLAWVGGICGFMEKISKIENCFNCGNSYSYTDNGYEWVGGIIGYAYNDAGTAQAISRCGNAGEVSGVDQNGYYGFSGGIAGRLTGLINVTNCFNTGEVIVKEGVQYQPSTGGIVGSVMSNASNLTSISYCYNAGAVGSHVDDEIYECGGIFGWSDTTGFTCTNCYYDYSRVNSGTHSDYHYISAEASQDLIKGYHGSATTSNFVGCAPLSSGQMMPSALGTPPSAMSGFTTTYWDFIFGEYPVLKDAPMVSKNPSCWDGKSSVAPTGDGSLGNPYIIASAANLRFLALNCNNASYANKYYEQIVDIDLNSKQWTPIYMDTATIYYNGNGHTIYNLYINNINGSSYNLNNSTTEYAGLFARIVGNSYIKNLTLKGGLVSVTHTTKQLQVGSILGFAYGDSSNISTVENCHNIGVVVNISSNETANNYGVFAGGVVGYTYYGNIKNCSNTANVTAIKTNGTISFAGGITSRTEYTCQVSYCTNYGNVYANSYSGSELAGGISADARNPSEATQSYSYCANYGEVLGIDENAYEGFAGGLLGRLRGYVTLSYSFNAGEVISHEPAKGTTSSGGLIGYITNPSQTPSVISYCYNTGAVGVHTGNATVYMGGLIGWYNTLSWSFVNCYYDYQKVSMGTHSDYVYLQGSTAQSTLWGVSYDVNSPSENFVNCAPLTTQQMTVTTNDTAPASMSGFTRANWDFAVNESPNPQNLPTTTKNLETSWDGFSSAAPTGAGTQNNPYIIASAANLRFLALNCNSTNYMNKYYEQSADIDLCNHEWMPINMHNATIYYDGKGHTIYNLHINNINGSTYNSNTVSTEYAGLFAKIRGNSYIKNLTINGGSITLSHNAKYVQVGAICAEMLSDATNKSTIDNCHNINVTINAFSSETARGYGIFAGGIVGHISYGNVTNCENHSNLTGNKTAGGTCWVGGIAGYIDSVSKIENCINYGSVFASVYSGSELAGGIAGRSYNNQSGALVINCCANYGEISGLDQNGDYGFAAGIIGEIVGYVTVSNCFNTGEIIVKEGANYQPESAGIVGSIRPASSGVSTPTISYCYNIGAIGCHVEDELSGLGGIFGWSDTSNFTVTNCYYDYTRSDKGTHADYHYLPAQYSQDYVRGRHFSPSSSSFVNCAPLSTTQMTVSTSGTAPSSMSGFTTDNWIFIAGEYPILKSLSTKMGVKVEEISYWDGISSAAPTKGDGSAHNPYIIDSAAKLRWVSANSQTNGGAAVGKYFLQTVDIDLNGFYWMPITETAARAIYYDGGNHTIYNLYINKSSTGGYNFGFIGFLGGDGYLRNLTLENPSVNVYMSSGGASVAAFVGAIFGTSAQSMATLSNLHGKNVSVNLYSASSSETRVAGICSTMKYCKVNNCSISGEINGYFENSTTRSGGLFGSTEQLIVISDCINYANVNITCKGGHSIGGIAATLYDTASGECQIVKNCINYGNIRSVHGINGVSSSDPYVGGIIGVSRIIGNKISYCENYGEVCCITQSGTCDAGGIAGVIWGGTVIEYCSNYGKVTGIAIASDVGMAAGIVCWIDGATIRYCMNAGEILSEETSYNSPGSGGIVVRLGGTSTMSTLIEYCYNIGPIGVLNGTYLGASGGIAGWLGSLDYWTIRNCYSNSSTAGSGTTSGAVYISGSALIGHDAPVPSGAIVGSSAITTQEMQSSAHNIIPSGMSSFTRADWDFVKDEYPTLGILAYDVFYSNNTNAGTANVSVALGAGSGYVGVLSGTFTIQKATNVFVFTPVMENYSYNGIVSQVYAQPLFGEFTVVFQKSGVVVQMSSTSNVGTYTAVVSVAESTNYSALQTTITFEVTPCDLTNNPNVTVTLDPDEFVYDGQPKTPDPTVTYGS